MDGSDSMVSPARPDERLTYDDFLLFPEGDGLRHEIIDGVHYVPSSPSLRHQDLVGRLHLAIGNFLASHPGIGRVFLSPLDVVFTVHDVVEPDLVFVASDQTDILTEANIQGAPAIVIEILSKSTRSRDERIKKELFDRGGVREYWIVDPDRSQVTVYRRENNTLEDRSILSAADDGVLTTTLIPDFSLSVSDLFRPTT
jgi:Uma2 family endonuclease